MRLYNSLSQQVEEFVPRATGVAVYVCGITPYDTTHLGHAFTYVMADILIRHLEDQGLTVHYVQNVTDVDDDLLRKAAEEGEGWQALGNRWTAHYIQDMAALNVRPPDHLPRASSAIPQIIEAVQALLARGLAYAAGGSVYYRVDAWPAFGKLSHLPKAEMLEVANERGNRPDDPHKQHALDFVLWQAQVPGEPAWPSPWGPGRPGWHIECSTLAALHLGETVDLHGGGSDLIFPHHECEIAQAEPLLGPAPFVRHWFHTAMVRHQGEKMSKSLGNLVMVRDLLEHYPPDAIRLYLADHHYRRPWSFDEAALCRTAALAARVSAASSALGGARAPAIDPARSRAAFAAALDDDLNTPAALRALTALADTVLEAAAQDRSIEAAQGEMRRLAAILGLRLEAGAPEERVRAGWAAHARAFPLPQPTPPVTWAGY
jgi:L-cysteine:1D-myo-inositol 2-amino-2-deoxy-alpha-D-glucopyranoside ligase